MDRRERLDDLETALRAALGGWQATIETSVVGIVQSFDAARQTCTVQPAVQARVRSASGSFAWVTLPLLVDVPVMFPSGGGYTLTFPIAKGDEALVVFSSRCIDAWWTSGKVDVQAELRMHDLSDGFAFVGPRSQPRKLSGVSTTTTQLRSDDGLNYVEVAGGTIKVKAVTSVTIDAPTTTITGDLVVLKTATITKLLSYLAGLAGSISGGGTTTITGGFTNTGGTISSNGKVLDTHTHSGVQTGAGNTGAPN